MKSKNIKICGITTRAATSRVMLNNLEFLNQHGYDACIICEPDKLLESDLKLKNIRYIPFPMKAGTVNVFEVVKNVIAFIKIFRKERFDIIQYASCNASLYASIAGFITQVPVRILLQWGLTYLGFSGTKLKIFRLIEKITCRLSTHVQPDSHSNFKFAVEEHLFPSKKGNVIWHGSACGLDFSRFDITKKNIWREQIRSEFSISSDAKIYGFIGRVVRDKGINELLEAFIRYTSVYDNNYLLILGPLDGLDELREDLVKETITNRKIIFTGGRSDINKCYASLDYVVMPSYREGFSMVLLEAAAMGIPVISSNINGSIDFVIEKETGFLFDVKSSDSLYEALVKSYNISEGEYSALSQEAYNTAVTGYNLNQFNQYYLIDRNNKVNNNG